MPQVLEQAIADTLQFVSYAAHRGILLDKDHISNVVEAQRAGSNITSDQEKAFWPSASAIAKAVAPVTIESLAASTRTDRRDHDSPLWAARSYRIRTAVTLALLLVFQIYWLVGATVTTDLTEIRKRLQTLVQESIRSAAAPEPKKTDPNYLSKMAQLKSTKTLSAEQVWVERISARTNFEVLANWNVAKRLLLWGRGRDEPKKTEPSATPGPERAADDDRNKPANYYLWEFTEENVVEMQTAQIILTALLKYILPILYGALGASAYIVRTLATDIRDHTYSKGSNIRYLLRFYLGAVAGLSIAWFTSDPKSPESAGILQSLSPLALAFLAGYSVELLFSLLDRVVSAFSSAEPVKTKA